MKIFRNKYHIPFAQLPGWDYRNCRNIVLLFDAQSFSFLVKIKGENDLTENFKDKIRKDNHKDQTGFKNLSGLVSRQFSNLSVKIINAIPAKAQRPCRYK
jgi:hypothetical protein